MKRSCEASTEDLGIEICKSDMRHPLLLSKALELTMPVGNTDRADMIPLRKKQFENHESIFAQSLGVRLTSIPSATLVTQAGNNLLEPATSTRHRRHAPTSLKPSKRQRVGISIPASVAASKIVSFSSALRCFSSIVRVFAAMSCQFVSGEPFELTTAEGSSSCSLFCLLSLSG